MKRVSFLVIAIAAAAFAAWYVWKLSQQISGASVSALLPRETIFLVHAPDLNRTREEWHHSDIYLLYRESAEVKALREMVGSSYNGRLNLARSSSSMQKILFSR